MYFMINNSIKSFFVHFSHFKYLFNAFPSARVFYSAPLIKQALISAAKVQDVAESIHDWGLWLCHALSWCKAISCQNPELLPCTSDTVWMQCWKHIMRSLTDSLTAFQAQVSLIGWRQTDLAAETPCPDTPSAPPISWTGMFSSMCPPQVTYCTDRR